MSPRAAALPSLLAAALALSACTKDKELYPSLSILKGERVTGSFKPVAPEKLASPPPSAETRDRIAQLRADAAAANDRFLQAAQQAQAPVAAARGTEPGTAQWELGQVALAEVAARRSETMVALAELDRIYAEAQLKSEDPAEIEAAVNEVAAQVHAQDQAIDALETTLGN